MRDTFDTAPLAVSRTTAPARSTVRPKRLLQSLDNQQRDSLNAFRRADACQVDGTADASAQRFYRLSRRGCQGHVLFNLALLYSGDTNSSGAGAFRRNCLKRI